MQAWCWAKNSASAVYRAIIAQLEREDGSDPCLLTPQLLRTKADDLGWQVIEWLDARSDRADALWRVARHHLGNEPAHSDSWQDYLESHWHRVDTNTLLALASVLGRRIHVYDWIRLDSSDPRARTAWAFVTCPAHPIVY
jgi:hypothetical protein